MIRGMMENNVEHIPLLLAVPAASFRSGAHVAQHRIVLARVHKNRVESFVLEGVLGRLGSSRSTMTDVVLPSWTPSE